jgi:hypothetical protein
VAFGPEYSQVIGTIFYTGLPSALRRPIVPPTSCDGLLLNSASVKWLIAPVETVKGQLKPVTFA